MTPDLFTAPPATLRNDLAAWIRTLPNPATAHATLRQIGLELGSAELKRRRS